MTVIQFNPLSSLVQPAFWHDLVRLKIDVLKLSAESQTVTASYSAGKSIIDRETGKDVALGCQIVLAGDGFSGQTRYAPLLIGRNLSNHLSVYPLIQLAYRAPLRTSTLSKNLKRSTSKRSLTSWLMNSGPRCIQRTR